MKNIFYLVLFFCLPYKILASSDTSNVPLSRQVFHDKIKAEQKRADLGDGKLDGIIKVSNVEDVNLQVTDAIFRKVNGLRNEVENETILSTNNDNRCNSAAEISRYSLVFAGSSNALKFRSASIATFTVAIGVFSSWVMLLMNSFFMTPSLLCMTRFLYKKTKETVVKAISKKEINIEEASFRIIKLKGFSKTAW